MSHLQSVIHLLKTRQRVSIKDFAEYDPTMVYELRARLSESRKVLAREGYSIVHIKHDPKLGQTVKDNAWELVKDEPIFKYEGDQAVFA